MKRFLQKLLLLFLIIPTSFTFSQVANYTFSETVGTYTPIVGGTQLAVTTGGVTTYDTDGNYISLPLGSQFTFNGVTITTLTMTADGALWLNPTTTTRGFGVTGPISSTGAAAGVIAAMGMDLRSTQIAGQVYERRWQDVGTEVVFQWQNAARYLSGTIERFSFQVRITKATGVIRIVYGNMTTIANSTSYQPMVGLRGATNADFNNRRLTTTIPDATPNWGAPNGTTAGISNANNCRFTSGAPSAIPTTGLTFIWSPATASGPTNDLICNATTISCGSSLNGTTINATNSGTGENQTCGAGQSQPGVWYVVAGTGQQMTASLCATAWDSKISIFSGPNCSTISCVGGIDDNGPACTSASASYSFSTVVGTNYYILVHGYSSSSNFTLSLTCSAPPTPPTNDVCSNARSLPCATTNLAGTTVNSVSESAPLGLSSNYGVWYTFVGDGNQTTISIYGDWDTELLIMTGSVCGGYGLVAAVDNFGTFSTESYTYNTINGQTYYIYVAHYLTSSTITGPFTISRSCVTACNTTPGVISVNKTNTVTNDIVTYTVTGGNGTVTGYQYSFNNFASVAGTISTTNNPWNFLLNTTNSIVHVRAVTQNGTCNSTTSNIVSTTLRCATPYVYGTQYGDYITNVTFNTINNTSTFDAGGDGYQNFLATSTNVCRGLPYTFSVSGTNVGGFLGYAVWIDWNNNNDFSDVGENVFVSSPLATATTTITIPNNATLGSVKMRVQGVWNSTPTTTPCNTLFYDYGEIEEYTINIVGSFNLSTTLVNTDMVFIGRTSNVYSTASNWLQYNGTSLVNAPSPPNATTNVIVPSIQTCMTSPLTIAANSIAEAKSVTIEPNGELRLNGTLSVFKDFSNYGLVTNTNTTSQRMLEFVGSGNQDHLVMEGNNTLVNLRVNKPNGEVQLEDSINITNNLDIPSGDLRLNLKVVDLGTTGYITNEGDGHSAYCDCPIAYIQHTINIGPNVTVTPGNMGLEIKTNGNQMGTTIVRRRHKRAGSSGASFLTSATPSVFRIYEVIPQFNGTNYPPNGLNVDIKYTYLSHEVGAEIANEEALFTIWRSGDNGVTWEDKGGTIDLVNHTVSVTGFQQFSWITTGPGGETLPINLLSFDGTNKGEYNNLNWVTDNEINFSHFVLEKSRDGFNFEPLTEIPSNGLSSRSNYTSNDYNPYQLTYYRLKSIDLDGTHNYSNVIAIETKGETNSGILYPNPTSDIINYGFTSEENEKLEIKVLDMVGKVVIRSEVELNVGNNRIPINLTELISGNYTIVIKHTNSGVTKTSKVIKI